jgi:hypothetical protein
LPSDLRAVCLYAPEPEYPYAVYSRGARGAGTYRLIVDSKTGKVTELNVLSTVRDIA